MGAEISRQKFNELKSQIENTTAQNNALMARISPIEAETNRKTNEYNQLSSEKTKKLNLIKESQNTLNQLQENSNSMTQKIAHERSVIDTMNSFLTEYKAIESKASIEVIGSAAEELNKLIDDINSINTDI